MPGNIRNWLSRELPTFRMWIASLHRVRVLVSIGVIVLAALVVPTLSEFMVALYNRYEVYPPGTDTSMLAKSIMLSWVLSYGAVLLVAYRLHIYTRKHWLVGIFLFLGIVAAVSGFIPAWIVLPIIIANVLNAFLGKPIAFVPLVTLLLAVLIFFDVVPSYIPRDWCRYELTIYPCVPSQEFHIESDPGLYN